MSAPSFHQYSPGYWMQQPSFNNQLYNAPSDYEQPAQYHPPQWQFYDDSDFGAHAVNQHSIHSPQSQLRPHRRALSNSTNGSYGSVRSPHSHPTPLPYSSGYDNSYLDAPYETYSNTAHFQKHLPTPTHTPTQESFMDNRGYNRRNKPAVVADSAVAAHKALRPVITGRLSHEAENAPLYSTQSGSNYGHEMPATPRTSSGDHPDDQYSASNSAMRRVPNFDRTMSEIYQDELYSPVSVPAAPAPNPGQQGKNAALLSPYRTFVTDRLQAANEARSSKVPAGRVSRDPSPFRQGSPFAGTGHGYGPIGTAAGARQQQKAEADALAYQQHHAHPEDTQVKTISPKDAVLDYHDQADDSAPPLFPQTSATSDGSFYENQGRAYGPLNGGKPHAPSNYPVPSSTFSFQTPSIPASAQIPSGGDFKYTPPHRPTNSEDSQEQPEFPAHLISMETSKSEPEAESHDSDIERPVGSMADGGTYTCTYHGCTQRFATPALLQKHKREGHRASIAEAPQSHSQSPGGMSSTDSAALRNTQAGPHRCDRINPSTGKPCNTIFSRPYDLTRHEDTIHAQRTKVRCQYCTEEKSFSRSDALTRHMRVVHPNIDFPGKHRRRHVD